MSLPRSPWQWVLFIALIAQIVICLLLLTGDYSQAPTAIARDIRLVCGVSLVMALVASACLPTATEVKSSRICLIVMVALTFLCMFSAVLAGALTGWVIIPTLAMALGVLLLYRQLAAGRADRS